MRVDPRVVEALGLGTRRAAPPPFKATRPTYEGHGERADAPWERPIPFNEIRVPEFPVGSLPGWLEQFVSAEAVATQTPADLSAMLALAVLSTACAGKFRVQLKEGHQEPLNLFTAVVLAPANRKSAVFKDATAPVEEFEREEAVRLKESMASALQDQRVLIARLKSAEDKAARAKSADRPKSLEEARRIREELDSLIVPVQPRLIVDDCSPEKLASLLHQHLGRIALLSPEGDVFDMMAGRYSSNSGPNLGVYLKGHAGDSLRVDRQGRGSEFVDRPALTLGLAIQPEVLRGLVARPGFRGRGLLARFLYSIPRSTLGHRDVQAPPVPDHVRTAYHEEILRILRIPFGTDSDGCPAAYILRPDPEARQVFLEFERELEPKLSEYGELAHIADWAGKVVGAVGRIAGLLHVAASTGNDVPWTVAIARESAESAVRVGEYVIAHARAAFGQMGGDPQVEDAQYLRGWLQRAGRGAVSRRDIFQATKGRFRNVAEMEPGIRLLEEHGHIRKKAEESCSGAGRKPSPSYEVNPAVLAHYSHNLQNGPPASDSEDSENCGRDAVLTLAPDYDQRPGISESDGGPDEP